MSPSRLFLYVSLENERPQQTTQRPYPRSPRENWSFLFQGIHLCLSRLRYLIFFGPTLIFIHTYQRDTTATHSKYFSDIGWGG
jgi:hypothetical protein